MNRIDAVGVALPRLRIPTDEIADAWGRYSGAGIEEKTVAAADEDALTLAIEAAESALSRGTADAADIEAVSLATTTPPLDTEEIAPRLVRALGLPPSTAIRTFTQSTLAGAHALDSGFEADGPALVVAADAPRGDPADADHPFGAGAAAFLLADSGSVERLGSASHVDELAGISYRERGTDELRGLDVTGYERGAIRECVTQAVDGLSTDDGGVEVDAAAVDGAAVFQPDARMPSRAAGDLSVPREALARGTVVDRVGDAGAAGVPLGLVAALDAADDGDRTLGVFFGSGGGATAMLFEGRVDGGLDAELDGGSAVTYPEYLRERGYVGTVDVAGGGAHVSLPTWQRSLDQRYRLVAGRCPECEALTFPPEGACGTCHRRVEFERVELSRTGVVRAVTAIGHGGAPPEFAEQQRRDGAYDVALVELEHEGESVTVPSQLTDVDSGTVDVGDEVRAVVRKLYEQEGVPRYGAKFAPVSPSSRRSE
ncbi:zinc ribbon domain-containing protein [Haloprofundus halophilus]|uniref:zinc ribbon domain-containing protein n=1 Tax=Haloprofundus halophilus TaxID=2283527 RepID=UPI000E44733C|nr:zinc ribbon domain-containing protein [Haloprofundus halophilus]